jgi:hypothetical protein
MKALAGTAALFAIAIALEFSLSRRHPDPDLELAESLIGPAPRIDMPGPPAFGAAGAPAALFFECRGEQGPIRGVLVVDGATIRDVIVLRAAEGTNRAALTRADHRGFAARFRGLSARPPVVVQAVSGATISSQAVIDAVNERLKAWRAARP